MLPMLSFEFRALPVRLARILIRAEKDNKEVPMAFPAAVSP
jgi:hypothetical protein